MSGHSRRELNDLRHFRASGAGTGGMGVVGADDAAERLTELILAACSEVVGPELSRRVLALPKERVRPSPKASAGGADYRCHAPVTVFRKLDAMTPASRDASGADAPEPPASSTEPGTMRASRRPDGAIDVVVVSALGVARHRTYADATQIADAVIEAMDPRALSELVADVRVELGGSGGSGRPDHPAARLDEDVSARAAKRRARSEGTGRDGCVGTIALLTKRRLLENGANGALLCRRCGHMFAGDKGLATHQQVKHGRSYESAKAAVAESRVALVATQSAPCTSSPDPSSPFANPSTTSANFQRAFRRAGEERGSPLPPGLAAARDGDLDALRDLCARGVFDPRTCVDRHGSNALHWAAGSGHLHVCKHLVDTCGVDPGSTQVRDGRNAMHWAARNGKTDVCEWLWREKGVSVDVPTIDGTTAFHWAVWQGHFATCDWLVNVASCDWRALNQFGCNAAQWAAQSGDVEMCEWLARLGLDMTLLNNNGHSAVHKAAVKGRRETCEWLLDVGGLGADHVAPDYHDGMTPAEMARLEGHDDLAAWLREREDGFKDV